MSLAKISQEDGGNTVDYDSLSKRLAASNLDDATPRNLTGLNKLIDAMDSSGELRAVEKSSSRYERLMQFANYCAEKGISPTHKQIADAMNGVVSIAP
jgi:hypothetical protein